MSVIEGGKKKREKIFQKQVLKKKKEKIFFFIKRYNSQNILKTAEVCFGLVSFLKAYQPS